MPAEHNNHKKATCNKMTEQKKSKWFTQSTTEDRLAFGAVFLSICLIFLLFYLSIKGVIDIDSAGGCAFKRNFDIPCPTCGWTTSIMLFVKCGTIKAFCVQPAAATGCIILLLTAFFSLLSVVLGVNFSFLPPVRLWQLKYILIAAAIIICAGWAVTLARAFAEMP